MVKIFENKTTKYTIFISLILGIFLFLDTFRVSVGLERGRVIIIVGCILLTGYLFAEILKPLKLPKLTGYMVMGIIIGPYFLNIVSHQTIKELELLESLALSFIALNAGGELHFRQFREYKRSVLYILIFQIVIVFVGVGITFLLLGQYISVLRGVDYQIIIGFSILFAAVSISKSPSTTIGIITELNAKGKVTDVTLTVTVLKSISLVLLFPLIIAWAKMYFYQGEMSTIDTIIPAFKQLLSSIFMGIIIGFLTVLVLSKLKEGTSLFLLGIAIVITELSSLIGLEILLSSMIVGIIVQNFSKHGESLIKGLELFSLPIYISFFLITGASLHLDVISKSVIITIVLIIVRMLFIYIGTYTGSKLAGESLKIVKYSWMGFIGQAGIALGLSVVIEKSFPGPIGESIISIMIATIVINELIGPILFKYLIIKVNEANEEQTTRKNNYLRM